MPVRPFSMRETLDGDQPRCAATSLPCSGAAVRSRRSSWARRRSRTDGLSRSAMPRTLMLSCNLASHLSPGRRGCDLLLTRPRTHHPLTRGRTAMNGNRTPQLVTRDVYDIAQLAGGLPRVIDTAVAVLLARGRLKVDVAGRLQ